MCTSLSFDSRGITLPGVLKQRMSYTAWPLCKGYTVIFAANAARTAIGIERGSKRMYVASLGQELLEGFMVD